MGIGEVILLAIGLSVDVAVISVGAGALARVTRRRAVGIALLFAAFHAAMPLIGWQLGSAFAPTAAAYGVRIGSLLLFLVGAKMLRDALRPEDTAHERDILRLPSLLVLAFAASIDALIVGVSFSFVSVPVLAAACIIGIVTFVVSLAGMYAGRKSRRMIGTRVQLIGACLIIALAIKLFVIS